MTKRQKEEYYYYILEKFRLDDYGTLKIICNDYIDSNVPSCDERIRNYIYEDFEIEWEHSFNELEKVNVNIANEEECFFTIKNNKIEFFKKRDIVDYIDVEKVAKWLLTLDESYELYQEFYQAFYEKIS